MITLQNITFTYDQSPVLQGLSYAEQDPVITGLWGRNGAGKTTMMKLLAGHMEPKEGSIKIIGHEPYNNPAAQQHLCYMQEDHPFSSIWSIRDALRFYSYFNPNWNQELAERLMETFRLPGKRKTNKLSTGMKTALQAVIGLASQADVTILDEPTNGLDAAMRKKFYEVLMESYEAHPRLILLSTHQIEELQLMLDAIVVVHGGKVLLHEQMEDLREKGIWLTGESEQVNQLVQNHRVIEEQSIGSVKKVMIDDALSDEWKSVARTTGISVEKAHLQDYLLQLTEDEREVSK
ncbi:ABC transporter ATP-binding protein [Paenibacillus glucanolyticus]